MEKILLFSPVPISNQSSGISIRINQLHYKFKELGLDSKIGDNFGDITADIKYFYIIVSTKSDSISTKLARNKKGKLLIVDLYTPILLEKETFLSKWKPQDWITRLRIRKTVGRILKAGDYFLVANRRQKIYWYKTAQSLKVPISAGRIITLPTGTPKLSVVKNQPANVILWFGGIYPWLNPSPLIESFALIAKKYPNWKLRILGGFHPRTGYLDLFQKVIEEAQNKIPANQLEIVPWQKTQNLQNFLKDASFAVHLPKRTQEDYYAHRVRLLTLLSSGVPVLTAGSDIISQLIVGNKVGFKINHDPQEIASALTFLIKNPKKLKILSKNALKIESEFIAQEQGKNVLNFIRTKPSKTSGSPRPGEDII